MTGTTVTVLAIPDEGTSHEYRTRGRGTDPIGAVLRRLIGGAPELIPLPAPDLVAWHHPTPADDDGDGTARRTNPLGARLLTRLGGPTLPLLGPLVLTGLRDGSTAGLTDPQVDALLAILAGCR